jgi:hypothetical protein
MKGRGIKPDYQKIEVNNEITEVNPMESMTFKPKLNFMMEETWEWEFEEFF